MSTEWRDFRTHDLSRLGEMLAAQIQQWPDDEERADMLATAEKYGPGRVYMHPRDDGWLSFRYVTDARPEGIWFASFHSSQFLADRGAMRDLN